MRKESSRMNRRSTTLATIFFSLALVSSPVQAGDKPPADPTSDPVMVTSGFLSGHPDLRFRLLALQKRSEGKMEAAFGFFQRAAYYGDKPSAGMVAEMLWDGTGTLKDHASAYAWMDLAAERGYEGFLDLRERYWAKLDEAERKQALIVGQNIYARYGDAVALPRIATALRMERRRMTGSRTGFSANLRIIVPTPGGGTELIEGSKFYDERYWDPVQYQQWHDAIWSKPRVARVDIGEVTQLPKEDINTRIPKVEPAPDVMEPEPTDEMPLLDDGQQP